MLTRILALLLLLGTGAGLAGAAPQPRFFPLRVENQDLRMAYRDLAPTGKANGQTVLLLHGKNFSGFYWERVMGVLAGAGYRVIAPDQLGFGRSSRPDLHYSFHLLAANTRALLDALGVGPVQVVAHSMGGMLAVRFALMYPERVAGLVLENPIGLEDYRPLTPYAPLEQLLARELAATEGSMRDYQKTYYPEWKPEYEPLVADQAAILASGEFPRAALAAALTYAMIYEQPVVYELPKLAPRTLLIIGQADRTALGKAQMTPAVRAAAGDYPRLGRATRDAIPHATLVELPGVGHIPHVQAPEAYDRALLAFLQGSR